MQQVNNDTIVWQPLVGFVIMGRIMARNEVVEMEIEKVLQQQQELLAQLIQMVAESNQRLTQMDQRLDSMDQRLGQVEQQTARIEAIEHKLDKLSDRLEEYRNDSYSQRRHMTGMEADLNQILRRLERLEDHVQI